MADQYNALKIFVLNYIKNYGGFGAVITSPFLHLSLLISLLNYDSIKNFNWVNKVETLIPSLLGFSLGSYAIFFTLLTPKIKSALHLEKNKNNVAYIDEFISTFFHYIIVQCISLLFSFLYYSTLFNDLFNSCSLNVFISILMVKYFFSFLGNTLLYYSIFLTVASAILVSRLAGLGAPQNDN